MLLYFFKNKKRYNNFKNFRDIIQFFDPILLPDGTRTGSMEVLLAHLLAVGKMLPIIRCDFCASAFLLTLCNMNSAFSSSFEYFSFN